MKEFTHTLADGTVVNVTEIKPDTKGHTRYLVEDPSGLHDTFTITPDGDPEDSDGITPSQKSVVAQIKHLL